MAFVEAVDAADDRYREMFDLAAFHQANSERLGRCSVAQVEKHFQELVYLPVRHDAPRNGNFIERAEYSIRETINDYQRATVVFTKVMSGATILSVKFELVARADHWVITNMNGWFESYIFEACRP